MLRTYCNNFLVPWNPEQSQFVGNSVQAVQSQLARTLLTEEVYMAHAGDTGGMADIKKNLRRMYELLSISVMDNREMAKDVKKMEDTVSYTSYQISNHDARIDDNESNLRELMGKVDKIQEDIQRLISLNQVSRVNGVCDEAALPMEEESVAKPGGNP